MKENPFSAFEGENCRVCTDINDWSKKAQKMAFETPKSSSSAEGYEPFPCPPDSVQLGTATWTFLHTMAAYYPEKPTENQKSDMKSFISNFSKFYPCNHCAEHLREELGKRPPVVESRSKLSLWFCELHNEVNDRLGKPIFDCSKVLERWRFGRKDC